MTTNMKDAVLSAWKHQFGPWDKGAWGIEMRFHPYTCPNRHDHPEMAGDNGVLVPTVRGWICPFCDYTQPLIRPLPPYPKDQAT